MKDSGHLIMPVLWGILNFISNETGLKGYLLPLPAPSAKKGNAGCLHTQRCLFLFLKTGGAKKNMNLNFDPKIKAIVGDWFNSPLAIDPVYLDRMIDKINGVDLNG
jgi:hypothetical protein